MYFIILLLSFNALSVECDWVKVIEGLQHESLLNRQKICDNLPPITEEKDLKAVLEFFYQDLSKKDNEKKRHVATKNLNSCEPTKESKALVIAFEGTGAYEPMLPATMASFNKCFGGRVSSKLRGSVYTSTVDILEKDKGRSSKWSGLERGIMSEMMTMKGSQNVDWFSFPSEEVEQLAGLEQLENFSVSELYNNIKDSVDSNPKGIQNARDCIKHYMKTAKVLGVEPKVILTSHSSGGRSLVKFAEHMKKDVGVDIDLAFSIDPVKEAHHAVEEVVPQKIGEPVRYTKWKVREKLGYKEEYPYSAVWSRSQPSSLYKSSNIKDHVNFYQKEDRLGLKMGGDAGRFGIHGSPMNDAENIRINGVGIGGHGSINTNSAVLKKFREKMEPFLK